MLGIKSTSPLKSVDFHRNLLDIDLKQNGPDRTDPAQRVYRLYNNKIKKYIVVHMTKKILSEMSLNQNDMNDYDGFFDPILRAVYRKLFRNQYRSRYGRFVYNPFLVLLCELVVGQSLF